MLETLFCPKSVAVVGASSDPRKVGHAVLKNLKQFGYQGKIHPVNPKGGTILGMTSSRSVLEIGDAIDLAVLSIPAPMVPQCIRECIQKGIGSAAIISAGFREAGSAGALLEEDLREIVRGKGIRVLGPNCLGVINTAGSLNATFAAGMLPRGRLAFFSQSGALGIAILDWAIGNNIGFSKFISLGNKADLNETDFIEYFIEDPETDVILGYIEDVVRGRTFIDVATRASRIKPVILVKAGGTRAGARAASSHTGALAGSDNAFNAAFKKTGIIRAEGVEDLFETAMAFHSGKIPRGNNLLIVTNAGGPGIIAADTAEKLKINLPQLSRNAVEALAAVLPKNASLYNPVDIIGDATAERYSAVLDIAMTDPNVDGVLVILTPQAMIDVEETARLVVSAAEKTDKPVITSFMGEERVRSSAVLLRAAAVPNFPYPEPAVKAFRRLCDRAEWTGKPPEAEPDLQRDREAASRVILRSLIDRQFQLTEDKSRQLLTAYGFAFPKKLLVVTPQDAASAAAKIGFPVVMKITSPDILHKTDVGGVRLGISTRREAKEAFTEIILNAKRFMPSAFITGVTVYETVPKGREVILGITYDRTFGHMVMFGLGGIYVEVLGDVSFRIVPVGPSEASAMIEEIKAVQLLKGVRGEKPADVGAIAEGILRLSLLAADFPAVQELDINPLVVHDKGVIALDARVSINNENA